MNVLESYKGISRSFHSSLNQSLIMTLVAQEVLRNWPESLPQEIKEPLILGTKEVVDLYIGTIHNKGTREHFLAEFTKKKVDWQAGGKLPDLYVATVSLLLVTAKQCPNTNQIDFTRIVYSQALVMQFAQLDAFMSDSMRIICQTCPEVLKSDKTMNWTDILSCGEWGKILDWIIEKSVYDFGWQSLRKRLEILDKRIGLAIDFADEQIRQIEAAELVRNLITHNGGNINQKYIDAMGQINPCSRSTLPPRRRSCDQNSRINGRARYCSFYRDQQKVLRGRANNVLLALVVGLGTNLDSSPIVARSGNIFGSSVQS